ncbi:3'-phosphoadenosine 5'-phosphosulfate 3'-phosphatase [Paenibacillus popilliae ATCC 14706]|uniref:3'-phosphoadenosine 5'-phosphosulfate 3'-phosphatase n=1 Tax=Paenibacillus popilliae ATCC 14706 TaxID=1212764 RepID=M9LGB9_PAEPP|nr:3'-phosphoadenosine 5'-phosphosulfate 3'-phosphatase [Paenibacillus popilliae ATCC 14706]
MLVYFFKRVSNNKFIKYVIPYEIKNLNNSLLSLFLNTMLPVVLKLKNTPIIVDTKDDTE